MLLQAIKELHAQGHGTGGSQDAELLAKGFAPYFKQLDISSLPNFHGYARMNLKGQSTMPFSFRTELDTTPEDEGLGRRIRTLSRLKYGSDCNIVEASIVRRLHSWKGTKEEEKPKELAPCVVNLILLDLGYQELEIPVDKINDKLKEGRLLTIRDIVASSKSELIQKYGLTQFQVEKLELCLEKLGCCLKGWGDFKSEKEIPDFDDL